MNPKLNIKAEEDRTPLSGGERSAPELSGEVVEKDRTVLKVTGLTFPSPDPEVEEKPRRRRFNAKYKKKILEKADKCMKRGELGALLRKEGLYHSHIQKWRKKRDKALLNSLTAEKRGRKPKPTNPLAKENDKLNLDFAVENAVTQRFDCKIRVNAIVRFQ